MKIYKFLLVIIASLLLVSCDNTKTEDAVIKGVVNAEISVGDDFDRMAGITATDYDQTDLTDKLKIDGVVNVNRAGTYTLTYKVTGKSGKEVSVKRTVVVFGNAVISFGEELELFILENTPFDPLLGVTAQDSDGSDLTAKLTISGSIVGENNVVDTSTVGKYEIVYSVVGKSGKVVTQTITLEVYAKGDATIKFIGTSPENPNQYNLLMGNSLNLAIIANARDYDKTELEIDEITYDESLNNLVVDNIFTPTEAGTYEFIFFATGETGVQIQETLTVIVEKQGLYVGDIFLPVLAKNINNDTKPNNSILIYTELKGMGEYGVLAIVDAHGYIIKVRDCYGSEYNLENPIKQGTPEQIRGIANNVGWAGANMFVDLLGAQGVNEKGIPAGGFAIYFSWNSPNATHPIRELGLNTVRKYGQKVTLVNLEIPGFDQELSVDDPIISGVEDVTVSSNEPFNPLEGITAKDANGDDLEVHVAFNNVDLTKPSKDIIDYKHADFKDGYYAVVYEVIGASGYSVRITRRVTVMPRVSDAIIIGVTDVVVAKGVVFDLLEGITAVDYDGTDLTNEITVIGEVNFEEEGIYEITYKVVGKTGNEATATRYVTISLDAYFVVSEERIDFVYQNEEFDPFFGIKAYDDETDISETIVLESSIYVSNKIDTSNVGDYELVYKVVGSNQIEVTLTLTLKVKGFPDATIELAAEISIFIGSPFDLNKAASAKDYDGEALEYTIDYDGSIASLVVENIFTPTEAGQYSFVYKATGANGNEVQKTLIVNVIESGITINGFVIPLNENDINRSGKPQNFITIYTELAGMGEYGVLVIVDAHGRIVKVRDCFGEQIDLNNPIKAGGPTSNHAGLPNFKTYDAYTNGLWTDWTKGGADTFEGWLGAQGANDKGIPAGGFAIYFANGTHRPTGLLQAREVGAKIEVYNLDIPNYDPLLSSDDAVILGVEDIIITEGTDFDPLLGITAEDADGTELTITISFNNVDVNKPVIPGAPRVVNTEEGRNNFAQGYYSVVYSVTGQNGYTVNVTRKVTVVAED